MDTGGGEGGGERRWFGGSGGLQSAQERQGLRSEIWSILDSHWPPPYYRTDSTGGLGDAEHSGMIERLLERNACDGPLGWEKPRRAALFPGDLGHAKAFSTLLWPISSVDPVLSSVEGTELTALGEMVRVCGREEAERLLRTFRVEVR